LTFSPDEIHLELRDNGSGFDPHQKSQGFGLQGLKERVAEMDGELELNSAPGQGTVIFVHLPLVKDIPDGAESNLHDHIA
jgi:signal transduction histidine kinase